MDAWREIKNIWAGEVSRSLKSGRLVTLLVLFVLMVGLVLLLGGFANYQLNKKVDEQLANASPEELVLAKEAMLKDKREKLGWFISDERAVEAVLTLPLVLLVAFKAAMVLVPFLISLMGFDQISGEVGTRTIRYYLLRVRRTSLVLGRFLAQLTTYGVVMTATTLVMVLVARLLNKDFTAGDMAEWTAKLVAASLVVGLAYSALTSLCSAAFRQSALSLVVNFVALIVIWFIAIIGYLFRLPDELGTGVIASLKTESPWGYLRYGSMYHFGGDLLHPDWRLYSTALLVHVGWALIFVGLAQLVLRRRDL